MTFSPRHFHQIFEWRTKIVQSSFASLAFSHFGFNSFVFFASEYFRFYSLFHFFRVKTCTDQNRALQQKVSSLEEQNKSLLEELKCLKEHVSPSNHNKKQTSTCILVLFLAFALVAFPFERSTFLRTQSNSVADSYSTMPGL